MMFFQSEHLKKYEVHRILFTRNFNLKTSKICTVIAIPYQFVPGHNIILKNRIVVF